MNSKPQIENITKEGCKGSAFPHSCQPPGSRDKPHRCSVCYLMPDTFLVELCDEYLLPDLLWAAPTTDCSPKGYRNLGLAMTAGLEKACHRCISKIASNACLIFGLLAFLALPLSMAFIGMKFLDDCPVQPLIPLYLLVGGVVGSLKVALLLFDSTRMRQLLSKSVMIDDDDDDEYPWRQNAHKYYIHLTLSLFLFLWFILGNYWVFSAYLPNFIPPFHHPQDYCDKTLYIFAIGVLLLSHTVLALLIICSCCIYCVSKGRYAAEDD